jgi:CRISPR/Cas system endoribonuclease Cas6 (RAMP superfamily)
MIQTNNHWHNMEFEFEGWEDKELIKFALDVGLSERNSLRFGFINLKD